MNWDEALQGGVDPAAPAPPDEPPGPSDEASPLDRSARLPLNDYGNGQRLMVHFGEDLMFVPRLGWHAWTGKVWAQDFDGMGVRRIAHRVPPLILEESVRLSLSARDKEILRAARDGADALTALELVASAERTPEQTMELGRLRALAVRAEKVAEGGRKRRAEHARFAKSAGNSSKITNMLCEAEPYAEKPIEALNVDPLVVNCETATLAFVRDAYDAAWTGGPGAWVVAARPHDRADLITKMMPVAYDPLAACPEFLRFLERIQPSAEMRAFLQRWFGYSMTGLITEQKLVFFHGVGRNGKSTLVDLVARIFGEYAASVPIESLTGTEQRKGGDATPDLVRVINARMVRASEPEEGIRFREATVKSFTGGEPLLVRRMREEFVETPAKFKLTISGNHKPNVRGTDEGIWRRILLVPFAVQIPREEVDPLLGDKLWAERSGILTWLLAGLADFLDAGLREPPEVTDATAEFRDDSDPVRSFLMDACEVTGEPGDFELARDLIEAFQVYQKDQGGAPWGNRAAGLRISEKAGGYTDPKTGATYARRRTGATSGYAGIRLGRDMRERLDQVRGEMARRSGGGGGGRSGDVDGYV